MLGDFADDRVLPHRYGDLRDTRFALVKLSDVLWFAADHAMTITDVQIDDVSIVAWEQVNQGDADGNVWTAVLLGAPAPPNSSITASGLGKLDATSGALIENPADVMRDVLVLAGRSETFPMLRAECAREGYTAAGTLDLLKSIRAWLDEIAYSFGAIWTPTAGRLFPTTLHRGPVLTYDQANAENFDVNATLEDSCDLLRVSYNFNLSTDRAQKYVQLSARPYRYGGVPVEVALKWTRKPSDAETIGRRMLQRMGGRLYTVKLTTSDTSTRPGEWRRFDGHLEWPTDDADPVGMVLAVSVTPNQHAAQVELEVILDPPTVAVTAHSIAIPPGVGAAVDVSIVGNEATFGVTDQNGSPIIDARVSLDGGAPKKTNAQGKVTFTIVPATPARRHELAVEAPGFTPFILDVYL